MEEHAIVRAPKPESNSPPLRASIKIMRVWFARLLASKEKEGGGAG